MTSFTVHIQFSHFISFFDASFFNASAYKTLTLSSFPVLSATIKISLFVCCSKLIAAPNGAF